MNQARTFAEVTYASSPDIARRDTLIDSSPGTSVFVRSMYRADAPRSGRPILLLHGARASGVASFDLDIEGGSLAADLAGRGFTVYLMDARGYGGSTRPAGMDCPPETSEPLTRSAEVVLDIDAVTRFVKELHDAPAIATMGWATGSQWLAHYAAEFPRNVSDLVLYNALWPVRGDWPMGDRLEDPEKPGHLRRDAIPGYGFATERDLLARWESSIPEADLDERRDPAVAEAYARTAIVTDPSAFDRSPPSLRVPLGALADSFLLSRGHRLFDPARITARVLALRAGLDFWSREMDLATLPETLTNAGSVECVTVPNATHFMHLDRPANGRAELLARVEGFLG